jgi:hypothetical protein
MAAPMNNLVCGLSCNVVWRDQLAVCSFWIHVLLFCSEDGGDTFLRNMYLSKLQSNIVLHNEVQCLTSGHCFRTGTSSLFTSTSSLFGNYCFSFPSLAVLNGVTDRVAGEATEYRVGAVAASPFPSQEQKQGDESCYVCAMYRVSQNERLGCNIGHSKQKNVCLFFRTVSERYFIEFQTVDKKQMLRTVSNTGDRLCVLVVRVPGYRTEMYCVSREVRTEFIYVM